MSNEHEPSGSVSLDQLDQTELRDLVRAIRATVREQRNDAAPGTPLDSASLADALDRAPDPFAMVAHPKKRAFLRAYAACGLRNRAAAAAGIGRSTIYTDQWQEDEDFQAGLRIAEALAAELLEDEAVRRAREGVQRSVGWYKGEPGGVERQYSDTLLIFLLKGQMPDKYGDRLQLKGALANIDMSQLPDPAIQRIANGENPLAVLSTMTPDGAPLALPSGDTRTESDE